MVEQLFRKQQVAGSNPVVGSRKTRSNLMKPLRFGLIATGTIAARVVTAMRNTPGCIPVAVASRSSEKAQAFADEFGVDPVIGYQTLLARPDVDAVYVATPHPQHLEWCLSAIAAGKHVLCEKPMTMTAETAAQILAAAREKHLLFMEAFMYRFHPQTRKLRQLVAEGTIGKVRWISADFGFASGQASDHRLFSKSLGGGSILDVGCYPVSLARMIAGAAHGQLFLNPSEVLATGCLDADEGTDWLAGAMLAFPGDIRATVRCATRFHLGARVLIEGTEGALEVKEPWMAGARGATIRILTKGAETILETTEPRDLYSFMIEEFADCWRAGKIESPIMCHADSLGNMHALERWYRQAGVSYEEP